MIDFDVRLVVRSARAQDVQGWTVPAFLVSLNISGLRRYRVRGYDLSEPGPFLALFPPGQSATYTYGPDRENWVLMGDTPHVREGGAAGTVDLRDGDEWISVPALVPLERAQVPQWQEEFLRLHDAFRDPLPAQRLRIRLGLAALLRPFIDRAAPLDVSPASRLKRLIENDRQCSETIASLSRRCGCHGDHLRELFVAQYGLSPLTYRNRCRLATAMALIGSSTFGVGEIGQRIGFAHVSHFSAFFRKESGLTPRQAIARFRHAQ
ncbi:MAG: helix-turn-helix transcriptional regulator [Planctomycetes bacterium]|nr:helix-turn-helix transcriptional regulator [Planctomycetota bacterium]